MALALNSPGKRLFAFTVFYIIEGIPQGFTETFLPTHFGKAGVSSIDVGNFGFWDTQPWAFKWLFAPLVDILFSRRRWLFLTQAFMTLSLLVLFAFPNFTSSFPQITFAVFVHNVFSATHDLSVDSIAVGSLPLTEGSAANGAMFGAQEFGNALGGSVALWLSDAFESYYAGVGFVVVLLALGFLFVTCQLDPTVGAIEPGRDNADLRNQLNGYFLGFRTALLGPGALRIWPALLFAGFPSGAALLRGPHCKTWMVAHGLHEAEIATIEFVGKMVSVFTMLAGGFLGSKVDTRKIIAVSYGGTVLVEAVLAMGSFGATLSFSQWLFVKVMYHFSLGFHIGPQMAIFQSLCKERIAATLFTIFCCLCNNADSWAKDFHGRWIEKNGYENTAAWDAFIVLVPLALICFVRPHHDHAN